MGHNGPLLMMRVVLYLLLAYCSTVYAKADEPTMDLSPIQVHQLFDEQYVVDIAVLPDLVERENKLTACVDDYVRKQSKSYSRVVQNNLYDLIHNFEKITSKLSGSKAVKDNMPYMEKIEALARVQCDVYNALGMIK